MTFLKIIRIFAQVSFMEKHKFPKITSNYSKKFVTENRFPMKMSFFVCSLTLWWKFPLTGMLIFHRDALEIGIPLKNYFSNNSKLISIQQCYINNSCPSKRTQLRQFHASIISFIWHITNFSHHTIYQLKLLFKFI